MPTVAFNICCLRDCVSRHNGGTSGAPLKPFRDDSVLRALSTLRGLRGAPEVPPFCREMQSLGQQMLNATVGINGLSGHAGYNLSFYTVFFSKIHINFNFYQNFFGIRYIYFNSYQSFLVIRYI